MTVTATANMAIESITPTADLGFLRSLKQMQKVVLSTTASEVAQAADGSLATSDLLASNTLANLATRAAATVPGTIFPVAIRIDDVAAIEPDSGSVDFEFTVSLSAPSSLPVSVDFATRGSTADSAAGDFTDVSGTIRFAPGETEQLIRVPVLADNVDELGEVFHVQLFNPQHGLLDSLRGVGLIRISPGAAVLPPEVSLGRPISILIGESTDLFIALPGIVSATVDWGDGSVEPMSQTDQGDRIVADATHNYAVDGDYEVVVTLTTGSSQTVMGRRSITVEKPSFSVDFDGSLVTLSVESDQIIARAGGVELFAAPIDDIGTFLIQGSAIDETLTIVVDSEFRVPTGGLQLHGAEGQNTIVIVGEGGAIDFTDPLIAATQFELVDLSSGDANSVEINAAVVTAFSPTEKRLRILSGPGDNILVADAPTWRLTDPINQSGTFLLTAANLAGGNETLEVGVPHAWQNFLQAGDVNNDGSVTALDALRVINELGRRQFSDAETRVLLDPPSVVIWPGVYFDQNGDDRATALDALRVINELARQANPGSQIEAEAIVTPPPNPGSTQSLRDRARASVVPHAVAPAFREHQTPIRLLTSSLSSTTPRQFDSVAAARTLRRDDMPSDTESDATRVTNDLAVDQLLSDRWFLDQLLSAPSN